MGNVQLPYAVRIRGMCIAGNARKYLVNFLQSIPVTQSMAIPPMVPELSSAGSGKRMKKQEFSEGYGMSKFSEKGYVVKENAPIYLTEDMDKTVKWFEDVLGWYSNIVERDDNGNGCYGVVFDMLPEVELVHLAPFTGFQIFCGTPEPCMISFMQVKGINKMYDYVKSNGWEKITEVVTQPWGGKTCSLTTIDGYIINIFE